MFVVFEQVFILFVFALAGYILGKTKLADHKHAKLLSTLEVYFFLPCTVFNTFASNFTLDYISSQYTMIILSAVILLVMAIIAHWLAKAFSKDDYEQRIYRYSLLVPNYGYMGYALAEALFGAQGLLNTVVFALPLSLYIYSVGFCMLTKRKFSPKTLIQPVILCIIAGSITGLLGLELPGVVTSILDKGRSCMAPISMLLTGMVISEFDLKSLLTDKKVYIMTLLRTLVIPCSVALILRPFFSKEIVTTALLLYAMPCGLNTVVFPKLIGENCETGAKLACVSSIAVCVTIPLCVTLFT